MTVFKIQAVLKLWRMQKLSLDGKVKVFKLLAVYCLCFYRRRSNKNLKHSFYGTSQLL